MEQFFGIGVTAPLKNFTRVDFLIFKIFGTNSFVCFRHRHFEVHAICDSRQNLSEYASQNSVVVERSI